MDKLNVIQQDIIERIYRFNLDEGKARLTDIAADLNLSKSRANQEVKKLINYGLVIEEKYCPLKLTGLGEFEAKKILITHFVVKKYLSEVLSLDEETSEQDACAIEHVISNKTLLAFLDKVKETNVEIYGINLEGAKNFLETKSRMSQMKMNEKAKIIRIEGEGVNKKRLMEMGLIKGEVIKLVGVAPFKDPMKFEVGDYTLTLRSKDLDYIIVERNINEND